MKSGTRPELSVVRSEQSEFEVLLRKASKLLKHRRPQLVIRSKPVLKDAATAA